MSNDAEISWTGQWPNPAAAVTGNLGDQLGRLGNVAWKGGYPDSGAQLMAREVVVVIVGFANAENILDCLRALTRLTPSPAVEIFIAENGGKRAMERLVATIKYPAGPCDGCLSVRAEVYPEHAVGNVTLQLKREDGLPGALVHIAEMAENLGYAGGVNAWLRPLLAVSGWRGVWVLNPDTEPTVDALSALVQYSEGCGKGMIGSCLVPTKGSDEIQNRGLAWSKFSGRTRGVDRGKRRGIDTDVATIEARLDSPSGASMYVSRKLIDTIGLMDESYFLYYEDLEWGCRAKEVGSVGYADRALVPHRGGATTRRSPGRLEASSLSIYLEYRNRILFVRRRLPGWTVWTVFMQIIHIGALGLTGAPGNAISACRGVIAGVRGETGRPERLMTGVDR